MNIEHVPQTFRLNASDNFSKKLTSVNLTKSNIELTYSNQLVQDEKDETDYEIIGFEPNHVYISGYKSFENVEEFLYFYPEFSEFCRHLPFNQN